MASEEKMAGWSLKSTKTKKTHLTETLAHCQSYCGTCGEMALGTCVLRLCWERLVIASSTLTQRHPRWGTKGNKGLCSVPTYSPNIKKKHFHPPHTRSSTSTSSTTHNNLSVFGPVIISEVIKQIHSSRLWSVGARERLVSFKTFQCQLTINRKKTQRNWRSIRVRVWEKGFYTPSCTDLTLHPPTAGSAVTTDFHLLQMCVMCTDMHPKRSANSRPSQAKCSV